MKLVYAILADAAEVGPNGKVYVMGGEFENIFVPEFPSLHTPLALLLRLEGNPQEFGQAHQLEVQVIDPDGITRSPRLVMEFVPHLSEARPGPKDRPAKVMLAVKFPGLVLLQAGEYAFQIFIDGAQQDSTSVYAGQIRARSTDSEDKDAEEKPSSA
jgi:hypothetical protein